MPHSGKLMNNSKLFLTVLEIEKFEIRVPAWLGKGPFSGGRIYPHMVKGTRNLCELSSIGTLISFMKALPS